MNNLADPICFLFDNGSLRPDSTLALRRVAQRLAELSGVAVTPVSLLHSNRITADRLGDKPAVLLEPALEKAAQAGYRNLVALPLFFGPSGAMVDYLPPRLDALRSQFPDTNIHLGPSLESEYDDSAQLLASALRSEITAAAAKHSLPHPAVIVTDHGSPLPTVTAVRNRIGRELNQLRLPDWVSVTVASMERREGEEYAFNDPLLEDALPAAAAAGFREIVVAQQFLFSGRHAGPGGDITEICKKFTQASPDIVVKTTNPIGESDEVMQLLQRRLSQTLSS